MRGRKLERWRRRGRWRGWRRGKRRKSLLPFTHTFISLELRLGEMGTNTLREDCAAARMALRRRGRARDVNFIFVLRICFFRVDVANCWKAANRERGKREETKDIYPNLNSRQTRRPPAPPRGISPPPPSSTNDISQFG
jgi:hypothetical protein